MPRQATHLQFELLDILDRKQLHLGPQIHLPREQGDLLDSHLPADVPGHGVAHDRRDELRVPLVVCEAGPHLLGGRIDRDASAHAPLREVDGLHEEVDFCSPFVDELRLRSRAPSPRLRPRELE